MIPALKENKFQKKAQAETNELETTKKNNKNPLNTSHNEKKKDKLRKLFYAWKRKSLVNQTL